MKSARNLAVAAITVAALSFGSCKKDAAEESTTTQSETEMTTDAGTTTPDTVQAPPVNDSNASGTTSGKMEQVP